MRVKRWIAIQHVILVPEDETKRKQNVTYVKSSRGGITHCRVHAPEHIHSLSLYFDPLPLPVPFLTCVAV